MHLTAATATLTVYFVGLIHFQGSDVIVPQTTLPTAYLCQALVPHKPKVVLQGLTTTAATCKNLGGTFSDSDCVIEGLVERGEGAVIQLPASTQALTEEPNFSKLPKVTDLCPGAVFNDEYKHPDKYAALLTLQHGTLSACSEGQAWVPNLTLTYDSGGTFSIRGKSEALNDNARVWIINEPDESIDETRMKPWQHFWWHYVMFTGACMKLPLASATDDSGCDVHVPHFHHIIAASGPFCSPTH